VSQSAALHMGSATATSMKSGGHERYFALSLAINYVERVAAMPCPSSKTIRLPKPPPQICCDLSPLLCLLMQAGIDDARDFTMPRRALV
jgi:hypothetical protein